MAEWKADAGQSEGFTIYAGPTLGRSCGGCKACCTQVPVKLPWGHKLANERCAKLVSRGCSVYADRPLPCRYWSCRWLFDSETAGLKRPDISGYIIDSMLDTILADCKPVEIMQVSCDPNRPDAHSDPALRNYLEHMHATRGLIALIRWSSQGNNILDSAFRQC